MNTKHIFAVLTVLSILSFTPICHAFDVLTVTQSGYWSNSNAVTSPWPGGILPTTNDIVEVDNGLVITNDMTNAACLALDSSFDTSGLGGTVIMAPNSTLFVGGVLEGYGTQGVTVFDPTATNCTVIYEGNSYWATRCNYWNLVFNGWGNFYNGPQNGYPSTPMTIMGNLSVIGTNVPPDQTNGYTGVYVECGDNMTVLGNLTIGLNCAWDCSHSNTVVMGTTTIAGIMLDQDTADGGNSFSNVIVPPSSMFLTNNINWLVAKFTNNIIGGLDLEDGTNWNISGSLTNNGLVYGISYASINFNGTGSIAGSNALTIPTMVVNGTYAIADSITLITNTPTLNGTLVFDLAKTNMITLRYAPTTWGTNTTLTNYYNGNLVIVNSGIAPASGNIYKFFSASNYAGAFASETFPSLAPGLSWADNLLTGGSIAVTGVALGSPTLTITRSGVALTLSWDSATYPGFKVQAQTNSGVLSNWLPTTSTAVSPYNVNINPAGLPVFYRLSNQ
jgi:hypothetical protein